MVRLTDKPFYLTAEQVRWVKDTLAGMSTGEKVGQLFCVMGQDYAPDALREMVVKGKLGGILFRPEPARSIRDRFAPLDEAAKVPILKAANLEEGGTGGITDGTLFGWPMLAAATDDERVVERFGQVCAVEGRSAGINWTFSPVCDIDMNFRNPITNVRTYGSDPARVLRFSRRYMEAVQACGMAACAKHFPGDGVDFRDQHLHPTYNSLSAQAWYDSYGAIYRSLIEGGLMSVMVGHICQPAVAMEINPKLRFEDCLPASLSLELLTGVLRGNSASTASSPPTPPSWAAIPWPWSAAGRFRPPSPRAATCWCSTPISRRTTATCSRAWRTARFPPSAWTKP